MASTVGKKLNLEEQAQTASPGEPVGRGYYVMYVGLGENALRDALNEALQAVGTAIYAQQGDAEGAAEHQHERRIPLPRDIEEALALLEGDGRRNIMNGLHFGPRHLLQELANVGGEALHIAPGALGVEGIEGQRAFAGARYSRDHGHLPEREIERDVFEVILLYAEEPYRGAIFFFRLHQGSSLIVQRGRREGWSRIRRRNCTNSVLSVGLQPTA